MATNSILIAANPKSGATASNEIVGQLQSALLSDGYQVHICHDLDQIAVLSAKQQAAGELRAIVAAGGDGTAAAVTNRITAQIPLLIFPLGTENLLAKHLGLNTDIEATRQRIARHRTVSMDVGLANGKMFLVMASCGFDALVVDRMHATRRGHINRWSYTRPILEALLSYRFPRFDVECRATGISPLSRQAAWLFVFNVPRYAAGLQFCPQADPLDGLLDVCTFQRPGRWRAIHYLMRLWFGSHQRLADFQHSTTAGLSVSIHPAARQAVDRPIPFQLDGDPGGVLPLEIEVLPGRLQLIV